MVNILIGCTGSVAALKLPSSVQDILKENSIRKVRLCATEHSKLFLGRKIFQKC